MKGGKLLNNRRSGQTIKHENRLSAGLAHTWKHASSEPNDTHNSVERCAYAVKGWLNELGSRH
jgi:hypothetical protein